MAASVDEGGRGAFDPPRKDWETDSIKSAPVGDDPG